MASNPNPVLVLGGGINGAATARELILAGVAVCLVDKGDIASGTTAYSSRLIHGGLRYLEYGEFQLVRESLDERCRLLRLAPQFVRPLRLFIPIQHRLSGLLQAVVRFFGLPNWFGKQNKPRGVWLVRWGLWLYDRFAKASQLQSFGLHRPGDDGTPPINKSCFRWLCSYSDAQILYPERFVVALLEDARRSAQQQGIYFEVFTYHRAELKDQTIEIWPIERSLGQDSFTKKFEPLAIINATGAWIDRTLKHLHLESSRLIGGTKGSHLVIDHQGLLDSLDGQGIYTEANDGRPVFLLPFGDLTLVGTTDIPCDDEPTEAVSSSDEINYLIAAVEQVFPHIRLNSDDILLRYSGIRPLPYVEAATPASITRRHVIKENTDCSIPLYSLIGGKITTCRSLAEETTAIVLERIGRKAKGNSRERMLPGGESFPADDQALRLENNRLMSLGWAFPQLQAIWQLCGTAAFSELADNPNSSHDSLLGTDLPVEFVRYVLRKEWVVHLSDLVERRLMLLYHRGLTVSCLGQLAQLMVEEGLLNEQDIEQEVGSCVDRLRTHFGRSIERT